MELGYSTSLLPQLRLAQDLEQRCEAPTGWTPAQSTKRERDKQNRNVFGIQGQIRSCYCNYRAQVGQM